MLHLILLIDICMFVLGIHFIFGFDPSTVFLPGRLVIDCLEKYILKVLILSYIINAIALERPTDEFK